MHIAIIILNYRTPELTLECLDSLEGEIDADVDVLVVDNASGDGSAARISQGIAERGWDRWVTLLCSPVNGGFGAGNNFGIRAVNADAYLLLNSDTLVRPGMLAAMRGALVERSDVGIVGPALIDGSGVQDHTFFRALRPATELLRGANTGPVSRLLRRFDMLIPGGQEPLEAEWLAFAAVLIRREVIERVGLFDEGYFMYFEDVDYCRRAREAGFKILYLPHVQMIHYKGASSSVTSDASELRRAPRYYYESRSRYFKKFFGRRGLWLANGLFWLGRCISWPRELIGHALPSHREHEALDIWIEASRALGPLSEGDGMAEPVAQALTLRRRGLHNGGRGATGARMQPYAWARRRRRATRISLRTWPQSKAG